MDTFSAANTIALEILSTLHAANVSSDLTDRISEMHRVAGAAHANLRGNMRAGLDSVSAYNDYIETCNRITDTMCSDVQAGY
jgi:hypothetical protein